MLRYGGANKIRSTGEGVRRGIWRLDDDFTRLEDNPSWWVEIGWGSN